MATIQVHTTCTGLEYRWDTTRIMAVQAAAGRVMPTPADYNYYDSPGISVRVLSEVISRMIDHVGAELVLFGRAPVIDQVITEICRDRDPMFLQGPESLAWWRGCLLTRVLNWNTPYAVWPGNEVWLMPLAPARDGVVREMVRYVDTTLAP